MPGIEYLVKLLFNKKIYDNKKKLAVRDVGVKRQAGRPISPVQEQ